MNKSNGNFVCGYKKHLAPLGFLTVSLLKKDVYFLTYMLYEFRQERILLTSFVFLRIVLK